MKLDYTEDGVRTEAGEILGFCNSDEAKSGVGQLTTFNQLGFLGVADRPDGWYLPVRKTDPAIILEAKASSVLLNEKHVKELQKNCDIVQTKYKKVVGILYNHNCYHI